MSCGGGCRPRVVGGIQDSISKVFTSSFYCPLTFPDLVFFRSPFTTSSISFPLMRAYSHTRSAVAVVIRRAENANNLHQC